MSFLVLEGVSKSYGAVAALRDISLALPGHGRTAVVGPSGSGKSTLLRLLAGFELPDRGRISLGGALLAADGAGVPAHRREVGIVAQDGALFPHLDVEDNIGFGLARDVPDRAGRIGALLDAVELARALRARRPHELSGGQQQRVALARALARKPGLMLLDEPFSALDQELRQTTRAAVARILDAAAIPCLLVTHDRTEALSFADQVAILRGGRLVQAGAPRDLYLAPPDAATGRLLGDVVLLAAEIRDGEALCGLGRVPVAAGAPAGPGEIMLRPEQIRILAPGSDGEAAGGCTGRVRGVGFDGPLSRVTVALDVAAGGGGPGPAPAEIELLAFSIDVPPVGARVRLAVRGLAHVLPRR